MKKPVMMETMNGIWAVVVVPVVVGAVVAGTTTVVVGPVVALVIIIVWSMRRKMKITMTMMVEKMALVFVDSKIMMMAAIKRQAAAFAVAMIAAGRDALRTHRNEVAKMYCLCRY